MNPLVQPRAIAFSLLLACAVFPVSSPAAEPEIRGLWIEAWKHDLKSRAGIDRLIADAKTGNFNSLIPQVRRRGDTLYFSEIEPRIEDSALASDFDALAYLIERAHAQNPPIEIHAWLVAYPIWRSQNVPPKSPNHPYNLHPEWLSQDVNGEKYDGANYQLDPGHPGVQQHLFDVSMELVEKYDIDGLHFDYIRLTGNTWGYNPTSLARFQKLYNRSGIPEPTDEEWRQFRRDQITQTLRKIYVSAIAIRPEVKISAATITWAPGPTNLQQWYNNTSAYRSVLQDWRGWMEEGILDLNIPMAYFREHTHPQDWTNWINFIKDHQYNRHAAIGPGIYLNTLPNVIKQFRDTRLPSPAGNRARGVFGYSYQGTNLDNLPTATFLHALTQPSSFDPVTPPVFAEPAPIPEMPWKTNPATGHLKGFIQNVYTGRPIDGATVHLAGPETRAIQTDATGFYAFVDLPPGNYTATAVWSESETAAPETMLSIAKGEVIHQNLSFSVPGHIPGPLVEIVVDNEDPAVTYTGDWQISDNPNGHGPTYHFALTAASTPTAFATYAPNLPGPGRYRIDTWHFESWNRAPDARFTISDGETEIVVLVDQQNTGRQWIRLADEIFLDPAKSPFVRLDNLATNNVVLADAVRWTWLDAKPPEPNLTFSIETEIVGEGQISGLPENGIATHGETLTLSAAGQNGFRFSHWEGNAWGSQNPLTLQIGADLHLRAVFLSPYDTWLSENFTSTELENPENLAPDSDPFDHGIPNLLKYAFGLDLRSPERNHLPRLKTAPEGLQLKFRRRKDDPKLRYDIVFSSDLQTWNANPAIAETVSIHSESETIETVTFQLPSEIATRLFLRLQVTRQ